MIRVTAAVLRRGTEVLVARRTSPAWLAGRWEFPGGKIEPGESARECLARELAEELGIECQIGAHLITTSHAYPQLSVELVAFEVEYIGGELVLSDHDRVAWVEPGQLDSFDMAPADLPIVRELRIRGSAAHGDPG